MSDEISYMGLELKKQEFLANVPISGELITRVDRNKIAETHGEKV